ncbi:MAG: DUF3285 domain-containing protein [Vulcanococcus sp.]|jgi:hypothetical protein
MTDPSTQETSGAAGENPSFTKLAMRNMVRKGKLSLFHFGLTALGFVGFIVLVAWLGKPQLPGA